MTNASAVKKSYIDGLYGQVHLITAGQENTRKPPLYLLHATAYSGQVFLPLIRYLSKERLVYAPDTPGYGGSDRPSHLPDLQGYASAFADVIMRTANKHSGPIDVLGYHTGVFIALEAAIQNPDLIRSLILIGVPHYVGQAREERTSILAAKSELTEDFEQFRERWNYFIHDRTPGLSLNRAFECFVDELRAYPDQWWAHEALFTFDTVSCLEQVKCPVLILNPNSPLAEPSREAATIIKNVELYELPSLNGAIFDLGTEPLCQRIDVFLSRLER